MQIRNFAALLAALSLAATATAQVAAEPQFRPETFRSHVAFLADDLLEGREAGTRGYDIAARYVAAHFERLGLKPAVNGSWYQPVPLVEYKLTDAPVSVTFGGKKYSHGEVFVEASPADGPSSIEADAVFVGYGLDAPALGFNDYAGLDVKGKIVVTLSGAPEGLPSDISTHLTSTLGQEKRKMAERRGAIGILSINPRAPSPTGPIAPQSAMPPGMSWMQDNGQAFLAAPKMAHAAFMTRPVAEALFANAPRPFTKVTEEAAVKGAKPKGFPLKQRVRIERAGSKKVVPSSNVLAILPGSDPALAGEYVLMMAHLDHEGIVPGQTSGDNIRNGAMDNATGIAALLETARAMATSPVPPRRPILFAAVTAEEKGLLGAQYLAKHPVVGNGRVVGVVNLDMPVLTYDFVDVIAFGAEHSTLGPIVERAGARMGVSLIPDPLPEQGLFARSDHYRFVQEGIPSVFLMTGFGNGGKEKFTGFLQTHYHKVSDQMDLPFDWNAGAKFARLNYLIAREIADADQAPRWYQNSFFGKSLAPSAPKATDPSK